MIFFPTVRQAILYISATLTFDPVTGQLFFFNMQEHCYGYLEDLLKKTLLALQND